VHCHEAHERGRQAVVDVARGSAQERGYDHRWGVTSIAHRRLYPLCGMRAPDAYDDGWRGECHELGRVTPATVTDHIRPPKGDQALFWDPRNRQSLCDRCNTVKAIRFEGGFGRKSKPVNG